MRRLLLLLPLVTMPAAAQPWAPDGRSWRSTGPDGAAGWGYQQGGVTYETHYPPGGKGPVVRCEGYRTNGGFYRHCT